MTGETHSMEPVPKPPTEFSRLVADVQGRLHAYILSLVYDRQVAQDVLQETNLVLCKKADDFEPGTNFNAWAFRIAHVQVLLRRRSAARDRLVFGDAFLERLEAQAQQEDAEYEARRQRFKHCLEKLSGEQRRLVLARYFAGKAVQTIAAERNKTANSISQALFRARRALVDCVNLTVPTSGYRRIRPWKR